MPRCAAATLAFWLEIPRAPAEVWAALTTAESTAKFLHGVALESEWQAGSAVTGRLGDQVVLQGQVLFAQRPIRVSYVLFDGPGQPELFVTWDVWPSAAGAMVCLSVDDFDNDDEGTAHLDQAWRPVMCALQTLLASPTQGNSKVI
jgi:uncharacterized protein YndB with AHSA1/START domain